MSTDKEKRKRRPDFDDDAESVDHSSRRRQIDPDERDEYEEWRRERGSRGRKRKDKAGGRHRRRGEDEF